MLIEPNTGDDIRVLVVDDDECISLSLQDSLKAAQVYECQDGSSILERYHAGSHDLVVLNTKLPTQCGFELCEQLRRQDRHVPVLFVSCPSRQESRQRVFHAGGNDCITKPIQTDELIGKVCCLAAQYQLHQAKMLELEQASSLIKRSQIESSQLQHVNRFALFSSQCKDLESLKTVFFHALHALETDGVLEVNGCSPEASKGHVSRYEQEILELSPSLSRIHSFGRNRALFRWRNCRLLVRKVGQLIDVLALLMDAMESSVERIQTEQQLLAQLAVLEHYCQTTKDAIANLFDQMTDSISNELLMLGIVSSLNMDEEERVKSVMENYNDRIQASLNEQDGINHKMRIAFERMRQPSMEFKRYLSSIQNSQGDQDSVELF